MASNTGQLVAADALELPPELAQEQSIAADHQRLLGLTILWDGYVSSGLSHADVQLARTFDHKAPEYRLECMKRDGPAYAHLFLTILATINTPETVQYTLTLVDDILRTDENTAAAFIGARVNNPAFPTKVFIRLLQDYGNKQKTDMYAVFKICRILSVLMVKDNHVAADDASTFVRWLVGQLDKKAPEDVNVAVLALMQLLRRDQFRLLFKREGGLDYLLNRFKAKLSSQALYQLVYCFWLLSYNKEVAESLADFNVAARLVEVLKSSTKEKVQRIILATLRNCADKANNNEQMIEAGAVRQLDLLAAKKWGDEDIVGDLEYLRETLAKNLIVLSSFDAYRKEVSSGALQWSPVHKSERFWRENSAQFESQDFAVLKTLLEMLRSSNVQNVAVACYDVGEFVRFHPQGKKLIQRFDAKDTIMKLMMHPNPEVQKEALLCVQKMMLTNWEFLSAK